MSPTEKNLRVVVISPCAKYSMHDAKWEINRPFDILAFLVDKLQLYLVVAKFF
jgi:hypothetical protein